MEGPQKVQSEVIAKPHVLCPHCGQEIVLDRPQLLAWYEGLKAQGKVGRQMDTFLALMAFFK